MCDLLSSLVVFHGIDTLPQSQQRVIDVPRLLHPRPSRSRLPRPLSTSQINYGDPGRGGGGDTNCVLVQVWIGKGESIPRGPVNNYMGENTALSKLWVTLTYRIQTHSCCAHRFRTTTFVLNHTHLLTKAI